MKKRSRKTLIRLLDKACSEYARCLAGNFCDFCLFRGQIKPNLVTDCFHFLSRQHYSTRWMKENLWGSCASCNILYEQDADFVHKVVEWYKKKWGNEVWDMISKAYHTPVPIKTWELAEKLETFK